MTSVQIGWTLVVSLSAPTIICLAYKLDEWSRAHRAPATSTSSCTTATAPADPDGDPDNGHVEVGESLSGLASAMWEAILGDDDAEIVGSFKGDTHVLVIRSSQGVDSSECPARRQEQR